ncbi:MAG: MobF family relaxase, partial [Cyanobacteria bacterium P01_G01_bin.4]
MLSLCNISAAQGETYYKKENYYSNEESKSHSQWSGAGAKQLGLSGEIDFESFSNLLHGQTPSGISPLPGRQIKTASHRAGIDLTFSAPKSVSIAALLGGDSRLEDAHRRAVQATLEHIEKYHAQARIWDGRKQHHVTTGNLIVAQFHHDTSRELDPQLHTHCVAISSTQCPDGKWKALTNESIYRNSKLLGSIYENELAYEVKQLGYEIEKRPHCMFELKGYSDSQLEHFSKRRQQILEYAGANATAKEKQWATLRTRAAKGQSVPRELLHQYWELQSQEASLNLSHPVSLTSPQRLENEMELARESMDNAVEHCAERRAAFRRTSLQKFVFDQIQPFNLAALEAAIAEHPDLLPTVDKRYTTEGALNREQATIQLMQNGRQQVPAIAPQREQLEDYLTTQTLAEGQQEAIRLTATTTDRFIAWQGAAGAGKTTALSHIKQLAERSNYELKGYAPSAEAAKTLG